MREILRYRLCGRSARIILSETKSRVTRDNRAKVVSVLLNELDISRLNFLGNLDPRTR